MAPTKQAARDRAWVRLAGALSARSGRRFVFGAAELMAARLNQLRRLSRLPRAFSVRAALPGDGPLLETFTGDPSRTARLLASGDTGFLALAEGRVVGMEWARLGPAEYDWDQRRLGVVFKLSERCCWLHNGSSDDGVLGPWAMVLGRLPDMLREREVDAAYLQVACHNTYSIRCHESLGFRTVGRVVALRVGPMKLVGLRLSSGGWTRWRQNHLDLRRLPI